jgi:hypothetical protein
MPPTTPTTPTPPTTPPAAPKPRAIDRARKAFHGVGRQRVLIPEWASEEGEPLAVYFTPLSQADLEALTVQAPKSPYEEHCYLLIAKLRDEQGQPLFDFRDKHSLMTEVESSIILRLKNLIWSTSSIATVDEAKQVLGDDKSLEFRLMLADRLNKSIDEVNQWPLTHLVLWSAYCSMNPQKPGVPTL